MANEIEYIIFTDASGRKSTITGRLYCAYAGAIVNVKTKQYTTYSGELGDRTVAFSEAYAIYKGVQNASRIIPHGKSDVNILVVTDSKLCVESLSNWIPNSWDLSDWQHWKKHDGTLVKNQEVYRGIIEISNENPWMNYRVTHINSHLQHKDWEKIKTKLRKYGIVVNQETADMFRKMNELVDTIATDITARMRAEDETYGPFIRLIRTKES